MTHRFFFGFVLGVGVAAGLVGVPVVLDQVQPAPHVIEALSLRSAGPFAPGGVLPLEATVTRREICDATVYRFIWNVKTGDLVFSESRPGNAAGVGEHLSLKFDVYLPHDLTSGSYRFESLVYNDCSGKSVVARSPSVNFQVR